MINFVKGSDAYHLMEYVVSKLDNLVGHIKLDSSLPIFVGGTDDKGPVPVFHMGIKEFMAQPDTRFEIGEAMVPIVGLFHEVCGHGGQMGREFNKDCALSKVLAVNHYGCKGSPYYYGIVDGLPTVRYFNQPHEIAAQYMGIKSAYGFLSGIYGEDEANHMICEYVKYRISLGSEFIEGLREDYTSVDDVLDAFNKKFQQNVFKYREYDPEIAGHDVLKLYAKSQNDNGLITRVMSCRNGLKQDLMMTSVYVAQDDPNDIIKDKPVFKNMDLSVEYAFAYFKQPVEPKPKAKDLNLSALDSLLLEADYIENKGSGPDGPDYG